MRIAHIACIELDTHTGMGRIATNWKNAFEQSGHTFIHIGRNEVSASHIFFWGYQALKFCEQNNITADVWLVHEPFSGFFTSMKGTLVLFSHGIEERCWKINGFYQFEKRSLRASLVPIRLRFYAHRKGFRNADLCLLSNKSDIDFLKEKGIDEKKMCIFYNGYPTGKVSTSNVTKGLNILFNGSWIKRKGIDVLVQAMNHLLVDNDKITLTLAGTGASETEVLASFNLSVRSKIRVVPKFSESEEMELLNRAAIFLLPSFFEGQSVALTQAMAYGLCPIVSNNSGQIDFVKDGHNGVVFETGNSNDLIDKIGFLIENKYLIEAYGKNAIGTVSDLTWESVTKQLVKRIESLA